MCNVKTPDKGHDDQPICQDCRFYNKARSKSGQWPCDQDYLPDEDGKCGYYQKLD